MKTNFITFQIVNVETRSIFVIYISGFPTSFSTTFCEWFSRKYLPRYILLADQISMSGPFTFWDNGQYVYFNYWLSSLWRPKFWTWP